MTLEQHESILLAIKCIADSLESIDSKLQSIDEKLGHQNDNLMYEMGPKLDEISSRLLYTN